MPTASEERERIELNKSQLNNFRLKNLVLSLGTYQKAFREPVPNHATLLQCHRKGLLVITFHATETYGKEKFSVPFFLFIDTRIPKNDP